MKFFGMVLAGALLLAPAMAKADDAYAGWTSQQLKVKAEQLQNDNSALGVSGAAKADDSTFAGLTDDQLKAKIADLQQQNAALKAKAAAAPAPAVQKATKNLLLDDFEGTTAGWWAGSDNNKLGTTLEPQPFVPAVGGSKLSPGHSARIHGHFGKNEAPYPWAQLALTLASTQQDIRGYKSISFFVKGDGGHYKVALATPAVKDFAFYAAEFDAPKEWTLVTLPLTGFAQPSWGKAVPSDFKVVEKINFSPTANDKDYDLSIDDLTLVK